MRETPTVMSLLCTERACHSNSLFLQKVFHLSFNLTVITISISSITILSIISDKVTKWHFLKMSLTLNWINNHVTAMLLVVSVIRSNYCTNYHHPPPPATPSLISTIIIVSITSSNCNGCCRYARAAVTPTEATWRLMLTAGISVMKCHFSFKRKSRWSRQAAARVRRCEQCVLDFRTHACKYQWSGAQGRWKPHRLLYSCGYFSDFASLRVHCHTIHLWCRSQLCSFIVLVLLHDCLIILSSAASAEVWKLCSGLLDRLIIVIITVFKWLCIK